MKTEIIKLNNVIKTYGDVKAVNGISFSVNMGEIFGLLGPNGAGKTTTIEMIVGLRKPDDGSIIINGLDNIKDIKKIKEIIGIQLQSTSLFDLLTVRELIELYGSFYSTNVDYDTLINDMLLKEKQHARVKGLSGGQKQRLAIALAIVHDPQIVFLDEPTTGLDPQARRTLWDIIIKLKNNGKTVILSTHYMEEAEVLCDRIAIVDSGKLIALDTPNNLIHDLHRENAIEFYCEDDFDISSIKAAEEVSNINEHNNYFTVYSSNITKTLFTIIQIANLNNWILRDVKTRTATLEDVFISMTGRRLGE
ncbi:MAG: transporter [Bacillales bacterium]|jgi:ABC-2 type transport system ATP-binding protein|nr:transporter [Bacillales bacterium]